MSSKSEQLNIRISSDLKIKLQDVADTKGMSTSDFIRQSLQNAITTPTNSQNQRLIELEHRLENKWHLLQRKIIMASATIASIDTGLPLDQCLRTFISETQKIKDVSSINSAPRDEFEKDVLGLHNKMQELLGVSDIGKLSISLIVSTYIAMIYSEDIFGPTPLSLVAMERLRNALEK